MGSKSSKAKKEKRAFINENSIESQPEPYIDPEGDYWIRMVFLGDTGVGKTSLIMSWTKDRFPTLYEPTVFDNYSRRHPYRGIEVGL